jgi:hypothetical protein
MWSVIRARQGLPYEHTLEPSFHANTQHLVTFSSKPQIEQLPADSVTLAFERATWHRGSRVHGKSISHFRVHGNPTPPDWKGDNAA